MLGYERLVIVLIALVAGVFFLVSGVQTTLENWAGQWCGPYERPCLRPEWFAVGAGCLAIAFYVWRRRG